MTSKLTRDRLQEIAEDGFLKHGESKELARMALAAMDSESVGTLSVRHMSYSGKKIGNQFGFIHSDAAMTIAEGDYPLYRHAQPVPVVSADLLHSAASAIEDLLTTKDRTGAGVWFDLPFKLRSAANAQPAPERDQVRIAHAEWSQATFGNVGPVGPLKHLSKEALEAATEPGDLSEWADMQFLLWDAQRRAGITDEQITKAMIEKLEVNKQREWPEPKDGEPRLHIKEQPAPVVPENCVTAEHRRVIEMLLNVCGAAFELADDSCQQDVDGEDCHVVPDDAFQKLSDALDKIENTLPTEDIDRPDAFLAWSAMPRAALKSILQAGNPPAIPDGYVMVPKEATLEMIKSGASAASNGMLIPGIYKAMLAAAPQEVTNGK